MLLLVRIVILIIQTEKHRAIKDNNSEQNAILKVIYVKVTGVSQVTNATVAFIQLSGSVFLPL